MPTTLTEWQKHLEQHFAALAAARADSAYPLFALEHGLESGELRSIKELLRAHIAANHWLASPWLVWVVYATEFGYEYFGDEYWQSFDEYTPTGLNEASASIYATGSQSSKPSTTASNPPDHGQGRSASSLGRSPTPYCHGISRVNSRERCMTSATSWHDLRISVPAPSANTSPRMLGIPHRDFGSSYSRTN